MKGLTYILSFVLISFLAKKAYYDAFENGSFRVESNIRYHKITFRKGKVDFEVTQNKGGFDFFVNSNFFTQRATAVGGLVIDKKIIGYQIPIGGAFVVRNGNPKIKFGRVKRCEYLSQSVVWAIKDGKLNTTLAHEPRQEERTHRLLLGSTADGEIVLIHSNPMMLVTMTDIIEFAGANGLTNAILLDSGSSVDLAISSEDYTHVMKTIPSFVKRVIGIDEPVAYIAGNFN